MAEIRTFETGATRDADDNKLDYEGFFSPLVLERYGEYMHKHRTQADGSLRASDNWQKGIPRMQYMKSLLRHTLDVWKICRGYPAYDRKDGHEISLQEALCAIMFNSMGMLHEDFKTAHTTSVLSG